MALADIVLTHVIEHFAEVGASEHIVFKGGSMLRRMHLGQNFRFSGDLDYTLNRTSLVDVDGTISTLLHNDPFTGNGFLRLLEKRAMMKEYESDKAELMPYLPEKEKLAVANAGVHFPLKRAPFVMQVCVFTSDTPPSPRIRAHARLFSLHHCR